MTLYVVTQPDPPAGTDFSFVVPGRYTYDITGITATLTTAGTVFPTVAHDASGHGHDGTYNFLLPTLPFVAGMVAGDAAIDFGQGFSAGNGAVTVPFGGISWQAPWTIELWVQDLRPPNSDGFVICCATGFGTPYIEVRITLGPPHQIVVDDGLAYVTNGPLGVPAGDGLPHHIVVTHAGTVVKIYVDGALVTTGGGAGAPLSPGINKTVIASQPMSTGLSDWAQDEVAIYTTALSAARVTAHHTAAAASFAAYTAAVLADAPLMYFHLDDGAGGGGRQPSLVVNDGTTELEAIPTGFPAVVTPGPYDYAWQPRLNADTQSTDGTLTTVAIPRLLLPAGYTVGVRTLDLQPSDQWSSVTLWWDDAYQEAVNPSQPWEYPPGALLKFVQSGG